MIRLERLSKWIAIVLIALVLGYFAFDNFVLSPQRQAVFHGSVTLSWAAPTENEDNSPLTDLAGYVIYYGTQAGQYSYTIHIDDPKTTGYKLESLSPGTYYFAITAINTDGAESAVSDMIEKTVP
jgi:hypothetical protein